MNYNLSKYINNKKPILVISGINLSELVIRNDATVAVPRSSHVENWSIGALDFARASNMDDTIAFSVFSLASRFHSRNGSVLGSFSITNSDI